jgi:predicted ABC-type exoprotein transport system permease subunit
MKFNPREVIVENLCNKNVANSIYVYILAKQLIPLTNQNYNAR